MTKRQRLRFHEDLCKVQIVAAEFLNLSPTTEAQLHRAFQPMKSPSILPLGNRILITPPPEKTEGAKDLQKVGEIFIPDSGVSGKIPIEAYFIATALAVGPDCATVKRGDRIIVPRQMLWQTTIDGKVLAVFVRETEVNAVVR